MVRLRVSKLTYPSYYVMLSMILYCIILYDNKQYAKTPSEVETRGPISTELTLDGSPWRELGTAFPELGWSGFLGAILP